MDKHKKNWKLRLGVILMIVSVPFFAALVVIPFMDLDSKTKITSSTVSIIIGEVLFGGGGLLVGKELFSKYKRYFNPRNWFKKKTEETKIELKP